MILGIIIGFFGCLFLEGVLFIIATFKKFEDETQKPDPMFGRERFK